MRTLDRVSARLLASLLICASFAVFPHGRATAQEAVSPEVSPAPDWASEIVDASLTGARIVAVRYPGQDSSSKDFLISVPGPAPGLDVIRTKLAGMQQRLLARGETDRRLVLVYPEADRIGMSAYNPDLNKVSVRVGNQDVTLEDPSDHDMVVSVRAYGKSGSYSVAPTRGRCWGTVRNRSKQPRNITVECSLNTSKYQPIVKRHNVGVIAPGKQKSFDFRFRPKDFKAEDAYHVWDFSLRLRDENGVDVRYFDASSYERDATWLQVLDTLKDNGLKSRKKFSRDEFVVSDKFHKQSLEEKRQRARRVWSALSGYHKKFDYPNFSFVGLYDSDGNNVGSIENGKFKPVAAIPLDESPVDKLLDEL